jgi:hypothetical protein
LFKPESSDNGENEQRVLNKDVGQEIDFYPTQTFTEAHQQPRLTSPLKKGRRKLTDKQIDAVLKLGASMNRIDDVLSEAANHQTARSSFEEELKVFGLTAKPEDQRSTEKLVKINTKVPTDKPSSEK